MHHPFTSPHDEDWDKLESQPGEVRAQGLRPRAQRFGDRRRQRPNPRRGAAGAHLQPARHHRRGGARCASDSSSRRSEYGTPPHGGIALGLDRIVAILAGETSIREVIAFPKTASAVDLMASAPSPVDAKQLRELHIRDPELNQMKRITVPEEGIETLFGSYDENLKRLESLFNVRIRTQGHDLLVDGDSAGRRQGRSRRRPAVVADARRLQARPTPT